MKLSKHAQNKIRIQKNKAEIAELDNQLAREAYFAATRVLMQVEGGIESGSPYGHKAQNVDDVYKQIQDWRKIDDAIWSNWNKARTALKRQHRLIRAAAK